MEGGNYGFDSNTIERLPFCTVLSQNHMQLHGFGCVLPCCFFFQLTSIVTDPKGRSK